MSAEWWIRNGDQTTGPFTLAQLQRHANAGSINAGTPVRKGTNQIWIRADRVRGLVVGDGSPASQPAEYSRPPPAPVEALGDDAFDFPTPAARNPANPAAMELPDFDPHGTHAKTRNQRLQKKMAATGGAFLVLLLLINAAVRVATHFNGQHGGTNSSAVTDRDLQQLAEVANRRLPRMEGESVRIERVDACPGKRLRFTITLLGDEADWSDLTNLEAVRSEMAQSLRSGTDTKKRLDAGVTFEYVVSSEKGRELFRFEIR